MKLLHLGDLHLGKSLGDFDLTEDQKHILDQIRKLVEKEQIDAVLIAGDVYDKSIPSEAATGLLDGFLSGLSSLGVKTYMISGNHDSDSRLNFGSALFENSQVFIYTVFDGKLHRYILDDGDTEVNIYLLPFVKASQVRRYYPEAKIENYEDAVRVILENAGIDRTKKNVLVAHQFVVAGKEDRPVLGGSEGLGTKNVGLVEQIGADLFDAFDYVALGHIHSPQPVGREEVRYSGSPLKYSLSEVNNEKSVPVITVDSGGVTVKCVPLKPLRNLRQIRGMMADLLKKENVTDPEDYIYATLTDEEFVSDAMGTFQQIYPHTVKIDYDNSRTREVEQVDISQIAENRSFEDLIRDFYRQMYNEQEISSEEMDMMRTVAREAGVLHEAD
ncbi:exonuclease SbcCD subunit D [[Clostridium] aminophilum]|uniref:exonuclease SbcCD subunit D n=1 Tax=[Clostridium] aminophilum TaxID=1526 RepID=UPI00333194A8